MAAVTAAPSCLQASVACKSRRSDSELPGLLRVGRNGVIAPLAHLWAPGGGWQGRRQPPQPREVWLDHLERGSATSPNPVPPPPPPPPPPHLPLPPSIVAPPPAPLPARLQSLEFSHSKVIRSVHTGGVFCMDLDAGEQRYLLAGAADASIAVYDTQQPSPSEAQQQQEQAREAAGTVAALTANAPYLRDSAQVAAARGNTEHTEHAAVLSITKQSPLAHKFSVSAVAWYPVDSGLFVSGELHDEDW